MRKIINNEFFRGLLTLLLGLNIALLTAFALQYRELINYGPPTKYNLAFIAGTVSAIILFAFIMRSSGHYGGSDEITASFLDRIPFDVYLPLATFIGYFTFGMVEITSHIFALAFIFICSVYLVFIFSCITLSVRCKNRTLLTNTIIYRAAKLLYKWLKSALKNTGFYFSNLSVIWKSALIIAAMLISELVVFSICVWNEPGTYVIYRMAEAVVVVLLIFKTLIGLSRVDKGINEIVAGNTSYKIDTEKMSLGMKRRAEKLNGINGAVSKAVNQQLKSEKLKTELITNVSHDIKTPLTSIINYVDLLGKENIETQPAKDYIEVISRQSARLKKLIEDLVEASKASTGNIQAQLATTPLALFINQAVGEYADRAQKNNLELVFDSPEEEVYILADGKLLWRIFDNLLGNACKYAQPGTRIYIDMERFGKKVIITFKNISKNQLNISSDELMERFVRGDSSRNTEGSGLGLSIARSLTEILSGKMTLKIDGDLFKATLIFDAI